MLRVNLWQEVLRSFARTLDDLARSIGTRTLFIATLSPTTFTYVYIRDRELGSQAGGGVLPISQTYCRIVLETGKFVCLPDTRHHPYHSEIGEEGALAYLGVPIYLSEGRLFGTLCATHDAPYRYSSQEIELMQFAGRMLGLLLDMEQVALLDPLTGVYGRAFLEHGLRSGRVRLGTFWGLLLIDFDALKRINDMWGHAAGDRAIQTIAERLQATTTDALLTRLGGDEFLIVLPTSAGPLQLEDTAGRILSAFAEPIDVGPAVVSVTASCGYAWAPEHGQGLDAVLAAADKALYQAKALGGHRAVAAQKPEHTG